MQISETPEWQGLTGDQGEIGRRHLRELFAEEPDRGSAYTVRAGDLYLDYSKNRLTRETVRLLAALPGPAPFPRTPTSPAPPGTARVGGRPGPPAGGGAGPPRRCSPGSTSTPPRT